MKYVRTSASTASALVMVSVMSVGPAVGVMALGLHSAGVLGKLYAESFENVRTEPVRAVEATGATRLAVAFFAVIPLALAPMTIHSLFRFEWNLRAATVVGMIGAGGIGGALYEAQQLFFYPQMMAYILITWLIVSLSDLLGQKTRQRAGCAYVPA